MSSGFFKTQDKYCVFIHVPKTAGHSISSALGVVGLDHFSISWFPQRLFSCSFVRNPWSRVVSAFFFLNQGGKNPIDWFNGIRYLSQYQEDFTRFVNEGLASEEPLIFNEMSFRPQHRYLCDGDERELAVDFVGKFERLEKDLERLSEKLGMSTGDLPHFNESEHKNYREYYTKRTRKIVAQAYRKDIEFFDYEF